MTGSPETLLERVAAIPSPGRGEVRFDLLAVNGIEEGRARFERLVTDVVKVVLGSGREIEARPGDWGIDTFAGLLSGGEVAVWQSKFFLHPGEHLKAHQAQIRESFKSVAKSLDALDLKLASWTLAVPGTMDPAMTKWFDNWRTT